MRRAYHAHFRRAEATDWALPAEKKFWSFWDTLVARMLRIEASADFEAGEIRRIHDFMGWGQPEQ